MSITFYYAPNTSASRVHWVLEELGIPYDKVKLDLRAGEQHKPEFLAINPNAKVPALVVDGTPMFESLAIIIYLGDRFGVEKGLWPRVGSGEHAEALAWSVWGSVTLGGTIFRLFYNTSEWFPAESRNAPQAETARKEFEAQLGILDQRLRGREYLVGDHFTLVDAANAAAIAWALSFIKVDTTRLPDLSAWLERSTQRPANQAVHAG
ncbi:glutathione S-transferase family protein [Nannocystis punicea]|uniref:Glutathione S-transferase family protein n=1 Tax=Nannocystis punicea TaxID=2995304 RepID=A0ABY7HGX3_9BACT|nr:glutathione S-transferase family protein [Nannocystis poenicansa]WAS98556.1 glutathione S-transferase family protein [Nannocystis poenicansa]